MTIPAADLFNDSPPPGPPDHWRQFYEFCRWEKEAGGPDPHMTCVGQICIDANYPAGTKAWLGALYAAVYNVPTAMALFRMYDDPRMLLTGGTAAPRLKEHWAGLAFRRERKAVRDPEKLARCLTSFAQFVLALPAIQDGWDDIEDPAERFEAAFADVCKVYGVGRYIGQKYIEYGRRFCGFDARVGDIRARDGWSPRESMALLMPEHAALLTDGGDGDEAVAKIEALAQDVRNHVLNEYGLQLDFYELQVLLCDYKQSWSGKRQYPGRSQDSELAYDAKISPHWGQPCVEMYAARARAFPVRALGEVCGWTGVRDELGHTLADYGYTWSDLQFDWQRSKNDLRHPVSWPR